MKNRYIEQFEKAQLENKSVPQFKAGDTLRVGIKIKEGDKTRVQNFEGVCIAIRGNGVDRTFTVRKMGANNIGVEKIFPLYSDSLEKIEVLRIGRVRRAKLYYLRNRRGKAARIKELRKELNKKEA
ncbi:MULTISPECIES: 50S ribosomal protein L19 [Helicobacter]|uniref:Large ribosomal subunit protein bL19 n=4 Tax=Helicobacter bilis TaxID=37372 RepID=C3XEC3_9HELI|nr:MULTISPECIES: 50S ribosomal protein L19 [Helicobacter]AQQ60052.1 50S ribosomal protein L19 [Helicobacter bilis]EEO23362.1 50S ribosomal protein L19 [Helicobacter bilis ATCC 43879]EMZ37879.1 50S ribosomal protein L19 [Helicobacter bilis WiWa]MCI7412078.1 50S ribosomal protein L19 [Helicobacter bilis]MDD7297588.1 50S ribosomal protein L19 [Helicobacter bilis]